MEAKFFIAGMMCEGCEKKVNDAVSAVAGVTSCVANSMKASAVINYDESVAGIEDAIKSAISAAGYEPLG